MGLDITCTLNLYMSSPNIGAVILEGWLAKYTAFRHSIKSYRVW